MTPAQSMINQEEIENKFAVLMAQLKGKNVQANIGKHQEEEGEEWKMNCKQENPE
jgi:hypothetical protein